MFALDTTNTSVIIDSSDCDVSSIWINVNLNELIVGTV